ncbi:MAG TPA: alanine--glyoxylate aminotransferase family protein, partial [Sorangium sp.]|nr:alanine--glyoxylate aminotransferase family protein [Sorangium sp.]
MDGVRHSIQQLLDAPDYEPVIMTGSGSSAIAAVLGSCLHKDERLLVIRNGAYGDRISQFAGRMGQSLVDMQLPYGERPSLEAIEQACQQDQVDAIALVYGCTSSCGLNPLAAVGAIAKRYGKKLLVDGVSAVFVEPLQLQRWGVAALMGSCNKGLHAHPNLTFALVQRDLMEEMAHIPPRAPSLELYQTWLKQRVGSHPFTIDPMSLKQVQAALDVLRQRGGVDARHNVYLMRSRLLRAGYRRLGLEIAVWKNMPMQAIGTALHIPKLGYDTLAHRLATEPLDGRVFEIYAAQGKLSDKLFRVFHMGEYTLDDYRVFLRSLERVLS